MIRVSAIPLRQFRVAPTDGGYLSTVSFVRKRTKKLTPERTSHDHTDSFDCGGHRAAWHHVVCTDKRRTPAASSGQSTQLRRYIHSAWIYLHDEHDAGVHRRRSIVPNCSPEHSCASHCECAGGDSSQEPE